MNNNDKSVVSVNFHIQPHLKQELERLSKATKKSEVYHIRKALTEYLSKIENQYKIRLYLKNALLESINTRVAIREETDVQVEQET